METKFLDFLKQIFDKHQCLHVHIKQTSYLQTSDVVKALGTLKLGLVKQHLKYRLLVVEPGEKYVPAQSHKIQHREALQLDMFMSL